MVFHLFEKFTGDKETGETAQECEKWKLKKSIDDRIVWTLLVNDTTYLIRTNIKNTKEHTRQKQVYKQYFNSVVR